MNQQLYQAMILEHNKKPRNFGALSEATHKAEGFNPLCGDHFWVYMTVDDNGVIQQVQFDGQGCAISKASASMMTEALTGQKIERAEVLFTKFQQLVKGEIKEPEEIKELGRLKIFSGIWQYPSRVKCAALAWHAMHGALDHKNQVSTE